jgi:hypothetical protein
MENNLRIKKFERILNKFAASMNLGRTCPDLMLKQKQLRGLRRPQFLVAAKQIKNAATSFLMNPEAPVRIEDMPRCRRCRAAPLTWSTVAATIPNIKMLFLARGGRLCEATRSAVEAAYSGEGGRRPFGFGGGDDVYRRFRYKGTWTAGQLKPNMISGNKHERSHLYLH